MKPITNFRLVVEYDGTRFSGWQEQKNARTIAGELRHALEAETGALEDLVGAGRTDAGVHALAQVAHVRAHASVAPEKLREAVNARLPAEICVLSLTAADARFHARHDAIARSYLYQISRRRTAFGKRYVWWPKEELDIDAMRAVLPLILGRHDFVRFCEKPALQKGTLAEVTRAEIGESGALVLVRFEAQRFLWRMVRRLTGALVRIGTGHLTADDLAALLADRDIDAAKGTVAEWTAPPSGLFLERVRYPGDPELDDLRPAVHVAAERDTRTQR